MSYLFSLFSLFNIWFILKQSSLFRMKKSHKDILFKAVSHNNNKEINSLLEKNFISFLNDNPSAKKKLLLNLVNIDSDIVIFDFKKLNKINKISINKILWYFSKKDIIEQFLDYNIFNTLYFNRINSSGIYLRERGVGDFACLTYTNLKNKQKIFFGSSKTNLDKISYLYLKDFIILERWKRRFLQ